MSNDIINSSLFSSESLNRSQASLKDFISLFKQTKYHQIDTKGKSITFKLHKYSENYLSDLLEILNNQNVDYELDRGEFWFNEETMEEMYFIEIIIKN